MKIQGNVQGKGKKSLWNKYFILVCLCSLIYGVATQMLNTTLSPFANHMWNSKTIGGYLTAMFNIGSIAMAFFCGPLVDKHGRRNCLVVATLLYAVPTVFCGLFPTQAVTLIARGIQGMAKGIASVAAGAIVADVTPRERMGEGMGYFGLGSTLAMAFGPMLGLGLVGEEHRYTLMFMVCAALYAASSVAGARVGYEKDPQYAAAVATRASKSKDKGAGEYKGIWRLIEKRALLPSLNYTIAFGSVSCVLVFLTVYAQEILELSSGKISLFYTVAAAAMFVVRLFGGRLSDKFGPLTMIIPAHLATLALLVILAFFARGNYPLFLLCGALYGIQSAANLPAFNAIAIVDSPRGRNGAASATFYFMMDIGILVASMLFGYVIDGSATVAGGYRNMFIISMGVCAVSLLLAVCLFNNTARARRKQKYSEAT